MRATRYQGIVNVMVQEAQLGNIHLLASTENPLSGRIDRSINFMWFLISFQFSKLRATGGQGLNFFSDMIIDHAECYWLVEHHTKTWWCRPRYLEHPNRFSKSA